MSTPIRVLPRSARLRVPKAGVYWLGAVFGLAGVGLFKNINLILLLAYFLAGMFAVNWWHVRRSQFGVTLDGPGLLTGFCGEWLACSATLVSSSKRAIRGLAVRLQVAESEVRWYLPRLAAEGSVDFVRSFRPPRRGQFANRRWEIVHGHPFGLIESVVTVVEEAPTVVYPRRGRLRLAQLLRQFPQPPAPRGERRTTVRHHAEGTDVHSLRTFRTGDSPRWIHWKTSARRGELMVRDFDRAAGPGAIILIDPHANDPVGWEAALSLAASIIAEWSSVQTSRLTVALPGLSGWRVETVAGRRQADAVLQLLAVATNIARPVTELPRLPPRTPCIAVGRRQPTNLNVPIELWLDPLAATEWYRPPASRNG